MSENDHIERQRGDTWERIAKKATGAGRTHQATKLAISDDRRSIFLDGVALTSTSVSAQNAEAYGGAVLTLDDS